MNKINISGLNSRAGDFSDWRFIAASDLNHPHWRRIFLIVKEAVRSCRTRPEHRFALTEEECFDLVLFIAGHEFVYGSGSLNSPEESYIRSVATGASLMLEALSVNQYVERSSVNWSTI